MNFGDHNVIPAIRCTHPHLVVNPFAQKRASHGGVDAQVAARQIEFIRTNQPVGAFVAVFAFDTHPGAEKHLAPVIRQAIHHRQLIKPLGQEAHAPVNFSQLLLAIDVLEPH